MTRYYFSGLLIFIIAIFSFNSLSAQTGPITGTRLICLGGTTALSDTTAGGSWSSSNPAIAYVGTSGIVTGVSMGATIISYFGPGIAAFTTVTVVPAAAAITGTAFVCTHAVSSLTDTTAGGTWSSSNTSVATVDAAGNYTGIAAGLARISYTLSGGCTVTRTVTVNASPKSFGTFISGCLGAFATLSDSTAGGTWSSSNAAVVMVDPATGNDSFSALGTAVITYKLPTGCLTTATLVVNPLPPVDTLTGGGNYCTGSAGVHIGLSFSNVGYNYSLYRGSTPVGSAVAGSNTALDFGPITTPGTYIAYATSAVTGCSALMYGTVTVSVSLAPNIYTLSGGGHYCPGDTGSHIILSNSDLGVTYALYKSSVLIKTLAGTGASLDFGLYAAPASYNIIATSSSTGCSSSVITTIIIDPLPTAYAVMGGGSYCAGGTGADIFLSGSQTGINYSLLLAGAGVATLPGTGTSLDFGFRMPAGTYSIVANDASTGCKANMSGTETIIIQPAPTADTVTGGGAYCAGGSGLAVGLSASSAGVNYRLYLSSVPVGTISAGTGAAISFGLQTAAGIYTVIGTNAATGCTAAMIGSATITINPIVTTSISFTSSPGDTVCPGTLVTYTATAAGGGASPVYTWKVNGIVAGSGTSFSYVPNNIDVVSVTMTSSAPCATPASVTSSHVMIVPAVPPISGIPSVCIGATVSLTDASVGGSWSSTDPAVATIATIGGSVGVSTGIAAGTSTLTYMLTTGCYAIATLTVLPSPAVTTRSSSACSNIYTLSATGAATYSWSPSTGLSCTTCDSVTVSPATTTTYTVTGTNTAGCTNTAAVTLNGNRLFGYITFSSKAPDTLDTRVWLIRYNPADSSIIALDSVNTCSVDSTLYYEFDAIPAGNYMVKAKLLHGKHPGASGYIPTYSSSSANWSAAATAAHTTGSDNLNIVMQYGTVVAGPGFISGYVYSGAGKGTALQAPAPGMLIYLRSLATSVLTYTYTDTAGAYSFPGIAYSDYVVYPEDYDYHTISSGIITLSTGTPSATDVTFKQYTTSRIIKPFVNNVGISNIAATSAINVYPNPSNGTLNVSWTDLQQQQATVAITDMIGREVYTAPLSVNATSGSAPIGVSNLANGIYIITIRSSDISYSAKLVIQK